MTEANKKTNNKRKKKRLFKSIEQNVGLVGGMEREGEKKRKLTLLLEVGELLEERRNVNNDTGTNNRGAVLVHKTYSHTYTDDFKQKKSQRFSLLCRCCCRSSSDGKVESFVFVAMLSMSQRVSRSSLLS